MSSSKQGFTPGPWQSQPTAGHNIHGQTAIYSEADGAKDIAIVYDGEANAQLIASAPELVEALRAVVRCLELVDSSEADVAALNKAEAALQKAGAL